MKKERLFMKEHFQIHVRTDTKAGGLWDSTKEWWGNTTKKASSWWDATSDKAGDVWESADNLWDQYF
jgi:hypothetical protein